MAITSGTWKAPGVLGGIGYKIPDFGLTERFAPILGRNPNQSGQSMNFPVQTQNGKVEGVSTQNFVNTLNPQKTVNITDKSTGNNNNNNLPSSPIPGNNSQQYIDQANNQANDYLGLIESEFNNTIGYLQGQEQGLRGQAESAMGEIGGQYNSAAAQLGLEQETAEQGVTQTQQTAETQAKSALQQARDVFRQTQQNNIAQLSALGISSSSVSEGLAERLGVETARRIASVTNSIGEVRVNAQKEWSNIQKYYSQKKSALEQTKASAITKIQQDLMAGINQINYARNMAQADKARQRTGILHNAQNQIASIQQQAQEFDNSLKKWAYEKGQALKEAYSNPSAVQNFLEQKKLLEQNFDPTKFSITPSMGYNQSGNFYGSWNVKPKEETEYGETPGVLDPTDPDYYK